MTNKMARQTNITRYSAKLKYICLNVISAYVSIKILLKYVQGGDIKSAEF